jgi:hypothetical protein
MNDSLQEYLHVVKPYLPEVLLSPQTLARVERVAKLIPQLSPTQTSPALLECRLEGDRSQVDLSVGLQKFKIPQLEYLKAYPFWQQLSQFSENWIIPGSLLYETIEDIWLEFDLDEHSHTPSAACWFFTLCNDSFKDLSIEVKTSKLIKLASILQNRTVDEGQANLIRHCLSILPEGASIVELGAMLTRKEAPLRLHILGIPPATIPSYLAQIQDLEIDPAFDRIVTIFSQFTDRMSLCFDLKEKIGSRIGLECFLDKQPKKDPRWYSLLDLLVEMGCCSSQKRDGLFNWPGLQQQKSVFDVWPRDLNNLKPSMDPNYLSVFYRTINHIKLVYQPDLPLQAKVYLGFNHCWFNKKEVLN